MMEKTDGAVVQLLESRMVTGFVLNQARWISPN